jgi:hypothetical protein
MWEKKIKILGTMKEPLGNGFTTIGVCTNRKEKRILSHGEKVNAKRMDSFCKRVTVLRWPCTIVLG